MEKYHIAVLIACYNRKEKTLAFLKSLTSQPVYSKLNIDIYILDDGSTDGTADAVMGLYPSIQIVTGTGNLFWAGGMRKIWRHAMAQKKYDLYLLFNDDVVLMPDALQRLLENYDNLKKSGTLLSGSTLSSQTNQVSYGGSRLHNLKKPIYSHVTPDEKEFIPFHLGNANIVLIDSFTVDRIGIFADEFTHFLADYDYTLRAFKNGIDVLLAPGYYGYCENDHGVNWRSSSIPLKDRIKYLYSPKGLAYKEYLIYIRKHFPTYTPIAFIKLWLKTLFPILWDKFKK